MELTFYCAPQSSALPVASALALLDVPHKRVDLDLHGKREQREPDFLKLNPNGKVPTLVVDGTPLFEALAILNFLGDQFGAQRGLWPAAGDPAHLTATAWSTWAYVSYSTTVKQLMRTGGARLPGVTDCPELAAAAVAEADELQGALATQLERDFLLGDSFGLVDLTVACGMLWGKMVGMPSDAHGRVRGWLDRCAEQPCIRDVWG